MELSFYGFRCAGKPTATLERIRKAVRDHAAGQLVPLVRFEKRPRREYYVFLGVSEIPRKQEAQTMVKKLAAQAAIGSPLGPFSAKDISSFVSGGFDTDNTHPFADLYQQRILQPQPAPPDLWLLEEGLSEALSESDPELTESLNRLLFWLSAAGEGSWNTFVRACAELGLTRQRNDTKGLEPKHLLRRLILLGHLECSYEAGRWTMNPPTLVASSSDEGCRHLAGRRTPRLMEILRDRFHCEETPQPHSEGPSRIRLEGPELPLEGVVTLENGAGIRIVGDAGLDLANRLPPLKGWADTLPRLDRPALAVYEIERFESGRFLPYDFVTRDGNFEGPSGMYRLVRENVQPPIRWELFFDQSSGSWLRGDWYGLRYLAAYGEVEPDRERAVPEIHWSPESRALFLPREDRWPMVYERSLVLASGLLPARTEHDQVAFPEISLRLIEALEPKLHFRRRDQ